MFKLPCPHAGVVEVVGVMEVNSETLGAMEVVPDSEVDKDMGFVTTV